VLVAMAQEPCVWLQAMMAAGLWAMVGSQQGTVEVLQMQAVWLQALVAAGAWAAAGGAQGLQNTGSPQARSDGQSPCEYSSEGHDSLAVLKAQLRGGLGGGGASASGVQLWSGSGGVQSRLCDLGSSRWMKALRLDVAVLALFEATPAAWRQRAAMFVPSPRKLPQVRANVELLGLLDATAVEDDVATAAAKGRAVGPKASEQESILELVLGDPTPVVESWQSRMLAEAARLWELLMSGFIAMDLMACGTPRHGQPAQDGIVAFSAGSDDVSIVASELDREVELAQRREEAIVGERCPIAGLFWLMLCGVLVGLV